jgi:membrane-associated phospholipid phosphatase
MSITVTIINFWWKISIHAVGSGALIALVVVLSIKMHTPLTWFLIPVIMASGLVMSARLWLNSHSPAEVWSGFLLGLLVPVLLLFVS